MTVENATSVERISRAQLIRRRFFRNKSAVFGIYVIAFMFLFAFGGPFIAQWSYSENDFSSLLQGPSLSHWFGTTQVGVDVFAQTTRGLQKSLIIGLLVAVFRQVFLRLWVQLLAISVVELTKQACGLLT